MVTDYFLKSSTELIASEIIEFGIYLVVLAPKPCLKTYVGKLVAGPIHGQTPFASFLRDGLLYHINGAQLEQVGPSK